MEDQERKTWDRDMRVSLGCECGEPDKQGVNHDYAWESGCRPYTPANFAPEPEMGYRCEFHWPKFYRYRVARVDSNGSLPWFRRPMWNAYRSPHGTARIGIAVTFGGWAYCVKWGNSRAFEVAVQALRDGSGT